MIGLMVVMLMVFFQVWRVGAGVSSLESWSMVYLKYTALYAA